MNFNLATFLAGLLDGFVDSFKLKNPRAFVILAGVLFLVYSGLEYYLDNQLISDVKISVFGFEIWLLDTLTKLIVALGFVSGAHTPKQPAAISIPADWTLSARYEVGDVVRISGGEFRCIKVHQAEYANGPFNPNQGPEYWANTLLSA